MSTNEARVLATFMIWAAAACMYIFGGAIEFTRSTMTEIPIALGVPAILGGCAWFATQAIWSSRDKSPEDRKD